MSNTNKNRTLQLPADDAYLPDQLVQWWYWTGHLQTTAGRRYGFELTFFAVSVEAERWIERIIDFLEDKHGPFDFAVQPVHFAITDIDGDQFHSRVDYMPGPPRQIANAFDLRNPFRSVWAKGGDGEDQLHGEVAGHELNLSLKSVAPPVIHYGGQRHDYSFGGYTYYYSRESMQASGQLTVDGSTEDISGTVWFDRQFGELVEATFNGWQWFALQLSDGVRIMLFDFRHHPEELYGSLTDAQGQTRELGPGDFTVSILDWWVSPQTQRRYPARWRITVAGMDLLVTPQVADQEINEPWQFPHYWEGACRITGDCDGRAYVELNGYPKA